MHWIITADHINEEAEGSFEPCTRVGTGYLPWGNQGPRAAHITASEIETRKEWLKGYLEAHGAEFTYEFRLFDGDNELYYEGICGDITDCESDLAFAPQDWAESDAGCVCTTFRKRGTNDEWEML